MELEIWWTWVDYGSAGMPSAYARSAANGAPGDSFWQEGYAGWVLSD